MENKSVTISALLNAFIIYIVTMVTDESVFKEALEYFKNLTKQELSPDIKEEIIERIESLSFIFRYLQKENEKLRKEIQEKENFSIPVSSSNSTPIPWWLQLERERSRASTGMVDLFDYKSPYKKRTTEGRLSTPFPRTSSGQRKPEPLRARNRGEQRDPPKEIKLNKYSPLPAIKTRPRPKLLRERTYDVIEPIYVKGPPPEEKVKLPEIKKPLRRESSLTPTPVPRRAASRGAQLTTPKRNKTLAPEQSPIKRTRQAFNPSNVAPQGDIPSNVFWFPM